MKDSSVAGLIFKSLSLVVVSLTVMFIIGEGVVRMFTPKGVYSCIDYDDETGIAYTPGSKVIYNKIRETFSNVNKNSFLDIEHNESLSDKGKIRVAFFGDSYVESMQIPLERRFFRLLPQKIENKEVEYFGFGMSGNGTLVSYLNYQKLIRKYDLNIVIYVFVENDLGDNILAIKKNELLPYAEVSDNASELKVDRTYRKHNSLVRRVLRYIYCRSLLANIMIQRIVLLKEKGIVLKLPEAEKQTVTAAKDQTVPDQNAVPSTWPTTLRGHAERTAFLILKKWVNEVRNKGREFVVLYVPRGEETLLDANKGKDAWKTWLLESCAKLDVPVIDPSEIFIGKLKEGVHMYDDHWTPEGHKAVAVVAEKWLRNHLKGK